MKITHVPIFKIRCYFFEDFSVLSASWIDLIISYSLLFSVSWPPYPIFWKISFKFLFFNFKILVILISIILYCFVMIPCFYSYFTKTIFFFYTVGIFIETLKYNAIYWGSMLEHSLHSY